MLAGRARWNGYAGACLSNTARATRMLVAGVQAATQERIVVENSAVADAFDNPVAAHAFI